MEAFYQVKGLKVLLFLFILLVSIIYLYCRYKLNYWKRRGVNQAPNTHSICGDFLNGVLFRSAPGAQLGEIYRKTPEDPFVGFYIFHKPCLLIKDLDLIKQIMIRDFDSFSDRHFAGSQQMDSFGMINLFGLNNPAWRYVRTKLTPSFTRSKLKQMLPLMIECAKPMMDYLEAECGNGAKVIDVKDLSYKFTADVIANIALGTKTDSFKHPNSEYTIFLLDFFKGFKRMVSLVAVFFMPNLVQWFGSLILFNPATVVKLFWAAFEFREKTGGERGDYIDTLIKLKNGEQNKIFKFEGDNLWFQSGMLFSGFEAGAIVITFSITQLANNKKCQDLAREEVKSATERFGWTLEAFNEMKYLDQCVSEVLRLHPPLALLDRYPVHNYKIPGTDFVIEKGTPIFVSNSGLHNDRKFFDEPQKFNPDRFAAGNDGSSAAYIPFGFGPRACIGVKLGLLQVKLVVAMILLEYEMEQSPEETYKLDPRSTFTILTNGIYTIFKKIVP